MHKRIVGMAMAALLLAAGAARAEEKAAAKPEAKQETLGDSIKKACNKELTTFCKGVPPGEGRILACLYAFEDKVSDQCVYAVYDASMQLEQAAAAVKFAANACKADLQKFCADVKPGKGRGLACLTKNDKDVSQGCKDALKQTGLRK